MRRTALVASTLVLGLAAACVEKGPPAKKVDKAFIKANILSEVPGDLDNVVNADFGKVVYLGNTVRTKVLSPGSAGSIVHYWKVVEAPGSSWRVFAHLNGAANEWMNLDATDMRTGYPPSKWKAGQIIRDEQKFTLADVWSAKSATLSVGLYQKGKQGSDARMEIVSGPKDAERRSPVFVFSVTGNSSKPTPQKEYVIRRASAPIRIDGLADDESWKNAPMSPNFPDAEGGRAVGANTSAQLLWDDQYLYAFVKMEDSDVYSEYTEQDDPLWKQDVIEFFIDADSNRHGYVELQVNPNNAHFDAWFPKNRGQKHHFEWTSKMKSAVVVHGTKDKRSDRDRGWDVELAIPLEDVKGMDSGMKVTLPPAIGSRWRLNVVRGDKPKDKGLAAASWNPITIQDFHALGRMLTVVFGDAEGTTEAPQGQEPEAAENVEPPASSAEVEQPALEESTPPVLRGRRNELRDMKTRAIKLRNSTPPKTDEQRKLERIGR